jgi:hypothetical protein
MGTFLRRLRMAAIGKNPLLGEYVQNGTDF